MEYMYTYSRNGIKSYHLLNENNNWKISLKKAKSTTYPISFFMAKILVSVASYVHLWKMDVSSSECVDE